MVGIYIFDNTSIYIVQKCKLDTGEKEENIDNIYNQNYIGKYCVCEQECDSSQGIMYKCINCEDWFHLYHLELPVYYIYILYDYI